MVKRSTVLGGSPYALLVFQPNKSLTDIVRTISLGKNSSWMTIIPLSRTGTIISESNEGSIDYWLYGRTTKKRLLFKSDISRHPRVCTYANNTRLVLFESEINGANIQTGLIVKIYDISDVPIAPVFTVDLPLLQPISTHTIAGNGSALNRAACGGAGTIVESINSGFVTFFSDSSFATYDLINRVFCSKRSTVYYGNRIRSDGTFFYIIGNGQVRQLS